MALGVGISPTTNRSLGRGWTRRSKHAIRGADDPDDDPPLPRRLGDWRASAWATLARLAVGMIQGDLLLVMLALPFAGSLLAAVSPANIRHGEAWLSGAVVAAGLGIVA